MTQFTNQIRDVLETDCGHTLEELSSRLTADEIKALLSLLGAHSKASFPHRQRAIFVLGRLGKTEAMGTIINAIPELDDNGRVAAADALGRLGGTKARNELVKLSSDSNAQVRKFAIRGLARIGGKAVVERLRTVAVDDPQDWIRDVAHKQLQKVK